MKSLIAKCALALVVGLSLCGAARADIIAGSGSVSGPGGVGIADVDAFDPTILVVDKLYDSMDFLDLSFEVDGPGFYGIDELVINFTPRNWGSFHFELLSAPVDTEFVFAFDSTFQQIALPDNGPPVTEFTFHAVDGGNVYSGSGFLPGIIIYIGDAGTVTIRETPIAAVPEPSTFALTGLGLVAGLMILRRRRAA